MAVYGEFFDQLRLATTKFAALLGRRPRREWFAQFGAFGDDFFSDE